MRVKIISDGTFPGTHVVNAETGEELENVQRIDFYPIDATRPDFTRAIVHLTMVEMEIEAETEEVQAEAS